MSVLVDTSMWSLAYRRRTAPAAPEVEALSLALEGREQFVTTGMILLELLRGFILERVRAVILAEVGRLPLLEPSRDDYIAAADLSNQCRRAGVQLPSADALIAHLAIIGDHVLLTADRDFRHAARHIPLRVWSS